MMLLLTSVLSVLLVFAEALKFPSYINSRLQTSKRIIGGSPVADGEFAFAALLEISAGGTYYCGGSLISPSVILTAAHCMEGSPTRVEVTLDCQTNVYSTACTRIVMDSYEIHPDYNSDTVENDYALIHLSSSSSITPIMLSDPDLFSLPDGSLMTVVGYGITSVDSSSISSALLQTDVYSINDEDCNEQYSRLVAFWYGLDDYDDLETITEVMLCAMNEGTDACSGDSGGPLFLQCDEDVIQVGVVSFGVGCAYSNIPGVYSDLLTSTAFSFISDFVENYSESLSLASGSYDNLCSSVEVSDSEVIDYFYPIDLEWSCNPYYFASMDGCDCDCGSTDPDCEQSEEIYNCLSTEECVEGSCIGEQTILPTSFPSNSPISPTTVSPTVEPTAGDSLEDETSSSTEGFLEDHGVWFSLLLMFCGVCLCMCAVCLVCFGCARREKEETPISEPPPTPIVENKNEISMM